MKTYYQGRGGKSKDWRHVKGYRIIFHYHVIEGRNCMNQITKHRPLFTSEETHNEAKQTEGKKNSIHDTYLLSPQSSYGQSSYQTFFFSISAATDTVTPRTFLSTAARDSPGRTHLTAQVMNNNKATLCLNTPRDASYFRALHYHVLFRRPLVRGNPTLETISSVIAKWR